jgi:competence protein ComEC
MISLAAAAALGILADQLPSLTVAAWLIFAALLAVVLVSSRRSRNGWFWVLLSVALAMLIHSRSDQLKYESASITSMIKEDEQPVLLRAILRSDVQRRPSLKPDYFRLRPDAEALSEWQTRFIAEICSIRVGDRWQDCSGGIFVTVDADLSQIGPGDHLELGGEISAFTAPTNPGESDFRATARNRRMHARLAIDSPGQVKILKSGSFGFWRFADRLARHGENTLQRSLDEDAGPLACALVVGRRSALDTASKDRLLETGTIHLLSVSGLHLGIVAMAMMSVSVLLGLGTRSQVALVGSACLLFAAMTGGNPPVLRASILVAILLTSLLVNRRPWPLNTLAFAAIVLMGMNPTNLTQVGVQLSFISVATLMCAARSIHSIADDLAEEKVDPRPKIETLIDRTRAPATRWLHRTLSHLRDLVWLSLCITLATTPLTWSHFNIISPVAVIANVILSFPAMIALLSGLIAVIAGWIWQPLAMLPAFVCDKTLHLMRLVIDTASQLPLGHLWLPSPPGWWVAAYYIAVIGSFAIRKRFPRQRTFVLGSLLWCVLTWFLAVMPSWQARTGLRATFVNVGHGTSALLEMPNGKTFLYDCGRLGNYEFTCRGIEDVLWNRGLTKLDAVILSHADSDHYNALPALIRRFCVSEIITGPGFFDEPSLHWLRDLIVHQQIPIREVTADSQWIDDELAIEILHPPIIPVDGNNNSNSIVLRIDHDGRSLLLPGDLEPPGTDFVINNPRPIAGGVLMAPHHGSLTANSQAILDWARPSEVIVSGGPRAKRPQVGESLRTRGSRVWVTANQGAIDVTIQNGKITVRGFRELKK